MSCPPPPCAATPTWPLPLVQQLARHRLVIPHEPDRARLFAAACALGRPAVAQAHAVAQAAVVALQPGDFLGGARHGGDPIDLYRTTWFGAEQRIGLSVFRFDERPELLLFYLIADGPPAPA